MSKTQLIQKMNADQVGKNLWVGGVPTDHDAVSQNFDALVLAAKEHQHAFPAEKYPKVTVLHAPLNDAKPTGQEQVTALRTALKVYELNKTGKKVLVTCAAGVNRSALIAGLAMVISGMPASKVVSQIRHKRHPPSGATPLFNEHFVKLLNAVGDQLHKAVSTRTP